MVMRILIGLAASGLIMAAGGPATEQPRPEVVVVEPGGQLHHVPSQNEHCTTCDGVALMEAGQYDRAMHVFTLRAAEGDGAAMANMGFMYDQGLGVPRDEALAFKWYSKAADSGDPNGLAFVGYAYQHRDTPDYPRAISYYRRAVDGGSDLAMNQMGYLYEHGLGVRQDYGIAYCWYMFAATNGNERAPDHLAELEEAGHAVRPGDTTTCQALNRPDSRDGVAATGSQASAR